MSTSQNRSGKQQGHDEVADEQDGDDQADGVLDAHSRSTPLSDQRHDGEERDGEDHEHQVGHRGSKVRASVRGDRHPWGVLAQQTPRNHPAVTSLTRP